MASALQVEEIAIERSFERVRRSPRRPAKIRCPHLPDQILHRERLLGWLRSRLDKRVILVLAEAGFGKTTLLADFARRSQIRTFWYRLDHDDTDALTFLGNLVASCQAADARLLPGAERVVAEALDGRASSAAVLETLLAELSSASDAPTLAVLDDYHAVEGNESIREVVERLIARAPEGMTFIIAGRRAPDLALGALRARNDLAEIGRDELRFDEAETARLFRDSYRQPLDSDVLRDLQARTEGWAASLQLARSAMDGRSPAQVRAFVRSLNGAEGCLHEYLAEEMVGEVHRELRDFLVRCSVLEDLDPETAALATEVSPARARQLLTEAQRLGLVARGGDGHGYRAHPLVREHLVARLLAHVGEDGLAALHRQLASALETHSWRLAARHWAAAGEAADVHRVISEATPTIVGTGEFMPALELIEQFPELDANPWFDLIRVHWLLSKGKRREALALAESVKAWTEDLSPGPSLGRLSDQLALARLQLGIELADQEMVNAAGSELAGSADPEMVCAANAANATASAAGDGSLDHAIERVNALLAASRKRRHHRHEALAQATLSALERNAGNARPALEAAYAALALLDGAGSGVDVAAAQARAAQALGDLGEWASASRFVDAIRRAQDWVRPRSLSQIAELIAAYGDPVAADALIEQAQTGATRPDASNILASARVAIVQGRLEEAGALLACADGHCDQPATAVARSAIRVELAALLDPHDPHLRTQLREALALASRQGAWFHWRTLKLAEALTSSAEALSSHVKSLDGPEALCHVSILGELVARRLGELDQAALARVMTEAQSRPERWRWIARRVLLDQASAPMNAKRAAEILEAIGSAQDVATLRAVARRKEFALPDAGRALIRRLTPRAFVEDLGRIEVHIGDRVVASAGIRRKVLSLLAFLLTRPQFTASREQVMEALWPDMDPIAAANSLNQTAYFLRRVFEPNTDDDLSAGYFHARGDLIWLDPELVTSRSVECMKLLGTLRRESSRELVIRLSQLYTGRFGVDFLYDDWSSAYRENLHAAYLDKMEKAIAQEVASASFDGAICMAQHAIAADPEAEQIELALLRLYRLTGAIAAAGEQYAHYAAVMRDQFGVEPPPLESI